MKIFGERLKELRFYKRINQKELAQALNMSQATITSWENDANETDFAMLVKIADYFDVTTDFLLGRTDDFKSKYKG